MSKPTMSEPEARKLLEEASAALEKQVNKGKVQFADAAQGLKDRLSVLDAEIASQEPRRDQLLAYKDHPEGAFHFQRMELLLRGNRHMRQMLAIELAAVEHNAHVLETGPVGTGVDKGENPFRDPANDPAYLEARAHADFYLAGFHWMGQAEAIDTILRVGAKERAVACVDADQEAACEARAEALRAAMKGNPELTMRVMRLSNDMQEAAALLDWAKSCLARLADLPPAARKGALEDADWAKMNGKALLLGGLAEQNQAFPALVELFGPVAPQVAETTEVDDGLGEIDLGDVALADIALEGAVPAAEPTDDAAIETEQPA